MSMARTVLITGANRGIGRAMLAACRARGDAAAGTARSEAGRAEIAGLGAEAIALDAADPASATAAAKAWGDRPLDLLVCNAGALIGRGGIDDPAFDRDAWATQLMTNVADRKSVV